MATAQRFVDEGDLRFAVELLNHVVFAEPDHAEAKELLAGTYTTLGHGAENATWRNFFLVAASELRDGITPRPATVAPRDVLAALSVEHLFDSIAIRIDGPAAWHEHLSIDWHFTDRDERWRTTLRNGVFVPEQDPPAADVDLSLTLTKAQLLGLLRAQGLDELEHTGDLAVLARLVAVVDTVDPNFPIVTP